MAWTSARSVVPGYRSHCSYIEVDAETGSVRSMARFGMQPADINTFYDPERASRRAPCS